MKGYSFPAFFASQGGFYEILIEFLRSGCICLLILL